MTTAVDPVQDWGSWHCQKFRNGGKCDVCSHMKPTDSVYSYHFGTKIKVHGRLSHDVSPPGFIRWYIYVIEDMPCQLLYCGSPQNPVGRFSSHKSSCNNGQSKASGLAKHFINGGCPYDPGRGKETLNFTLVDHMGQNLQDGKKVL